MSTSEMACNNLEMQQEAMKQRALRIKCTIVAASNNQKSITKERGEGLLLFCLLTFSFLPTSKIKCFQYEACVVVCNPNPVEPF